MLKIKDIFSFLVRFIDFDEYESDSIISQTFVLFLISMIRMRVSMPLS